MDASIARLLSPFVVVSVVASVWASLSLSPTTRFRARLGLGTDFTVSKPVGLVMWPLMMIFLWVGVSFVAGDSQTGDQGALIGLGIFSLVIILIGQIAAIVRARRSVP